MLLGFDLDCPFNHGQLLGCVGLGFATQTLDGTKGLLLTPTPQKPPWRFRGEEDQDQKWGLVGRHQSVSCRQFSSYDRRSLLAGCKGVGNLRGRSIARQEEPSMPTRCQAYCIRTWRRPQ